MNYTKLFDAGLYIVVGALAHDFMTHTLAPTFIHWAVGPVALLAVVLKIVSASTQSLEKSK